MGRMTGSELIDLYPEEILEKADTDRIDRLKQTQSKQEFRKQLEEFGRTSRPIWIFGLPRTGSTWFCKYFINQFCPTIFNEPFHLVACSSLTHTDKTLNLDSDRETERPILAQELGLTTIPEDRLLFSVIPEFSVKILFDFNIGPALAGQFPRSRFVWLSRDGRDVVESFHNPSDDSWPAAKFRFLGDEKRERFLAALIRYVMFTQTQLEFLRNFKTKVTWVKYEHFTEDFIASARKTLDHLGLEYSQEEIENQAREFDARHGMWLEWEGWQKSLFSQPLEDGPSADEINRLLGYGKGSHNSEHVWNRPLQ